MLQINNKIVFVRSKILQILYKYQLRLSRNVNEDKILTFLNKLKPISTNHKLIRIGSKRDGGYFVPDDLKNISSLFSAGIGDDANFELELANKGIKCFMADYSIETPPLKHANFIFTKKFIGAENNQNYIKFSDWFQKNSDSNDHILKIDIEGDEYDLLPSITEKQYLKMRIIILEIHFFSNILNILGFALIKLIFDRLQKNHEIVHINSNNITAPIKLSKNLILSDQLEITLLRKDRKI